MEMPAAFLEDTDLTDVRMKTEKKNEQKLIRANPSYPLHLYATLHEIFPADNR